MQLVSCSEKENRKEADMTSKDSGSGFAVGFVVGAVVGLAIGLLYAPRAGEETRQILKEKAGEIREKATEVTGKVKETATEAVRKARAKLEEIEGQAE